MWGLAVALLLMLSAQAAEAVCVERPLDELLSDDGVAWMFSGIVREVKRVTAGQIATIDVDHVWKGAVPTRAVIYNRQQDLGERRDLRPTWIYLVIAYVQTPADRARFGVADVADVTYEANGCTLHLLGETYSTEVVGPGAWETLGPRGIGHPSQIP